jgi:hypothetical protein
MQPKGQAQGGRQRTFQKKGTAKLKAPRTPSINIARGHIFGDFLQGCI